MVIAELGPKFTRKNVFPLKHVFFTAACHVLVYILVGWMKKNGKTLKGPNFEKVSLRFTLIGWEHSLILSEYFSGLCSAPETCHGSHRTKNFLFQLLCGARTLILHWPWAKYKKSWVIEYMWREIPLLLGCDETFSLTCRSNSCKVYLEDHSMTCKWLITMVSFSLQFLGLWDPFQMAELHGL